MSDDEYAKGEIEPSWKKRFNVDKLRSKMETAMRNYFDKNPYSTEDAAYMSQELSKIIRDKILPSDSDSTKLRMPRHKIIVQVFLGQKKEQKVSLSAKGYWDHYVDNYVSLTYDDDPEFFCSAIIFGLYCD